MRDLHNNVTVLRAISPVSVSDTTPQVSQIIDRVGFGSCEFVIATGSIADTDASFTVLLEDGEAANMSDAAAVPDDLLLGTEAAAGFQYNSDDQCRKLGYIGGKRYVRLTITPSANASAALMAAVCVLGDPAIAPTAV